MLTWILGYFWSLSRGVSPRLGPEWMSYFFIFLDDLSCLQVSSFFFAEDCTPLLYAL